MQKNRKRDCLGIAIAVVWMAVLLPVPASDSTEPCCFRNTRYEGICTITPGKGETCQGILSYLNNPMSTGKSYCGGTTIRRGWIRVDCKTGKPVHEDKNAPSGSHSAGMSR